MLLSRRESPTTSSSSSATTAEEYDVIVIGAGVNGLLSAAYLAKAGAKTLVLEERNIIGGGCTTEEVTLPGFKHDICAANHSKIQSCPVITDNELGLDAFGLKYVYPDPNFTSLFRDNKAITLYKSAQKSADEIARFSQKDAASYLRMYEFWEKAVKDFYLKSQRAPPRPQSEIFAALEKTATGRELMRIQMMSNLELVEENFEDDHVKAHMLRLTTQGGFPPEQSGIGFIFYTNTVYRHNFPGGFPIGGAQSLPDSLARCIEHYGGNVVASSRVKKILVEDGVAKGVELADGKKIRARKAVISSVHVKLLFLEMLDEKWVSEDIRSGIKRLRTGVSEFAIHVALKERPHTRPEYNVDGRVSYQAAETTESIVRFFATVRRNGLPKDVSTIPLQVLCHTALDPSRAPEGGHILNISHYAPYDIDGDSSKWEKIRETVLDSYLDSVNFYFPNVSRSSILSFRIETPPDYVKKNSSFLRGNPFGLDYLPWQSGYMRPLPGYSDYRTPLKGLYMTGACTWPGGAVQGNPGRNTAMTVLQDIMPK